MSVRRCEVCRFRNYAERKPKSLLAHIWRWHTGWCPGWKSYIKEREAEQTPFSDVSDGFLMGEHTCPERGGVRKRECIMRGRVAFRRKPVPDP